MRSFVIVFAAGIGVSCGAPRAAPISGDIKAALERGIAEGTGTFDHRTWDELVSRYAVDGGRRFDYAGLKKEEDRFERYVEALSTADVAALSASEIEALFINAYNAYTVRTILARVSPEGEYRIASIRDIENVFSREDHVVGGYRLSLDNIEHNVLRPVFRDPRLHFAVNCASISCPPIPVRAFTGRSVDEDLEAAARNVLQNSDYVSVEGNSLVLTKILDWYGSDFTNPEYRGSENSLRAFVRKYASEEVRRAFDENGGELSIRFLEYDWGLNRPEP